MTAAASTPTTTSHEIGRTYEDGLGGRITILEDGDAHAPMRFRMVLPKGFGPPAPERHPLQREDFVVLRGTLALGKVNGKRVVLDAGDTFRLPPATYHLPANGGDDELEFEATLTPGLDSAAMFASLYKETREHTGLGRFVRVAMVFRRHHRTISFPLPVRTIMSLIAALGRVFGVRAAHERPT
jgi:mannose-6-phosphate isomerase-like protein (cupin superfamily)